MSCRSTRVVLIALSLLASGGEVVLAQQSTIGSRLSRGGSSFSSGTRVGFGLNDGGSGGGFSLRGGGRSGFGIRGGQRNGRTSAGVATSVTVLDGHSGFFAAGVIRPWVTGVIPIVGGQPNLDQVVGRLPQRQSLSGQSLSSPIRQRLARALAEQNTPPRSSSARRSQASVPGRPVPFDEVGSSSAAQAVAGLAEIRAHKAARLEALRQRVTDDYDRGIQAQRDGKLALARNYYRLAAREATGPIRQQIAERLAETARQRRK